MDQWHEEDEFWESFSTYMFSHDRWVSADDDVEKVAALAGLEPGARVLDMPCGPGRHALSLARRGFHVTAVDRTTSYLERARSSAREESLEIEVVEEDMRKFRRPQEFDAAVNLFSSFGYFQDAMDDRRVADNFFHSLRPGGALVMELMGKEVLAAKFREREWYPQQDGAYTLEERSISAGWERICSRWILVRHGETKEFRISLRLYSAVELGSLLESVGFSDVKSYGTLTGSPYDQRAERLVVLARK